MFSRFDKAYVALLVSFLSATTLQFFGFEIDATLQAAIVGVVTGALTWLIPNKP